MHVLLAAPPDTVLGGVGGGEVGLVGWGGVGSVGWGGLGCSSPGLG